MKNAPKLISTVVAISYESENRQALLRGMPETFNVLTRDLAYHSKATSGVKPIGELVDACNDQEKYIRAVSKNDYTATLLSPAVAEINGCAITRKVDDSFTMQADAVEVDNHPNNHLQKLTVAFDRPTHPEKAADKFSFSIDKRFTGGLPCGILDQVTHYTLTYLMEDKWLVQAWAA